MFRGEILSGAGDGDWVIPHRARLEEVRLGLVEGQLAARLDLGDSGEVIGELEALVQRASATRGPVGAADGRLVPRRPPGRRAGDVPAGQNWLADELGLDPGLQLQQLEQQILVHDPSLGVASSTVRGLGPEQAGREPAGDVC